MRKLAVAAVLALLPGTAVAQLAAGKHYVVPTVGTVLPHSELLRNTALYRTFRRSDPINPVVTDIKLDPGVFTGIRYAYGLTRRLCVEAEVDWAVSVHAIRQLEIKPSTGPDDQPQYETTTTDARILQYAVLLTYFPPFWQRVNPFFTVGAGNHSMNLSRKGHIDADPVQDRMIVAGVGAMLPAGDRLGIRVELRDFMYNFRYDNQYVDPALAPFVVDPVLRPDFYNTTSVAGTKFQNDLVLSVGFMARIF